MNLRLVPKSVTLNGVMALFCVISPNFSCNDVVVKQLLNLPRYQNLLLIFCDHINTICAIIQRLFWQNKRRQCPPLQTVAAYAHVSWWVSCSIRQVHCAAQGLDRWVYFTSSSAIAEGPRNALSHLKSCQLLHNCTQNHIWLQGLPFRVVQKYRR